ncbi:MAG: acetolactate synthase large subunit, partial [Oscillospiraceae bacterium]|nr:acetolactate synthase large subunit [Oscillospiraceae bacterium]
SFQEVDIISITNAIVKHNFFVTRAEELAGTIRLAFEIANSGRKGPVLVDIPKDVTAALAEFVPEPRYTRRPDPTPDADALDLAAKLLAGAERPLIYCGGGVTFSDGAPALQAFAEHIRSPVALSMMGLTAMPSASPLCLGLVGMHGVPAANLAVGGCDVLLAVGARFSDRVAGSRARFAESARVIHIDIDPSEFSKNVRADVALTGNAADCLAALQSRLAPARHDAWLRQIAAWQASRPLPPAESEGGAVSPREVIRAAGELAEDNAIVATDVGQHQMFVAQYYPFSLPRTFLSSCGLGAMGYGMGAANGAAVGNPGKRVLLFTGDGSFHMDLAELAVAVTHRLPIVVFIMNNRVLGMVHQWQKLFYGGRYAYTELDERRTDFVRLAEAFGARGLRLSRAEDTRAVLRDALTTDGPCVVDCVIPFRERVFPIIPPGGAPDDMIYGESEGT